MKIVGAILLLVGIASLAVLSINGYAYFSDLDHAQSFQVSYMIFLLSLGGVLGVGMSALGTALMVSKS